MQEQRQLKMTRFGGALIAGFMALAGMAQAGEVVVVELFTSQGCSSCPPADRVLGELAQEDDVIALAYHVDYWDYLGWEDAFGQKAFSRRQHAYSRRVNREYIGGRYRGAFTPELVIAGSDSLVGSARKIIEKRIAAHSRTQAPATIALRRDGGAIRADIAPRGKPAPRVQVMLATYVPSATVRITRGENAGRTIDYTNIVTELRKIGEWDGTTPATFEAPGMTGPAVVFLQRGEAGRIIACAQIE
jgi:hypothetical protein